MPEILKRFLRYSVSGISSFGLDLVLLYLFVHALKVPYLFAVPLSFLIAVSVNYSICRAWVFRGTTRSLHVGYLYFLLILSSSLLIIEGIVASGVEFLGLNLYLVRTIASLIAGLWSFYLNLRFNFKMIQMHGKQK